MLQRVAIGVEPDIADHGLVAVLRIDRARANEVADAITGWAKRGDTAQSGGGGAVARLTNNAADDVDPAWSPDGSQVAFVSTRDGNEEVYIVNVDGTDVRRLTNNAADDGEPSWSP